MNDQILLQFLDLLKNAPSSVLLIAFAIWMLKKYLINGTGAVLKEYADRYLEDQKQHDITTKAVVDHLVTVTQQMQGVLNGMEKQAQKFDTLARTIGRRASDLPSHDH